MQSNQNEEQQKINDALIYAKVIVKMIKQLNLDNELGGLTILEAEILKHYIEQFEINTQKETNETR